MLRVWAGVALVLFIISAAVAVLLTSESQTSESFRSSMSAKIAISGEPRVGDAFTMTTTVFLEMKYLDAFDSANGTILYLVLPDGVDVVSGEINWTGDLLIHTNKTIETRLIITREGGYTIHAYAKGPTFGGGSGSWHGFHTQIYIESYNNSYIILPWKPIPNVEMDRSVYKNISDK